MDEGETRFLARQDTANDGPTAIRWVLDDPEVLSAAADSARIYGYAGVDADAETAITVFYDGPVPEGFTAPQDA